MTTKPSVTATFPQALCSNCEYAAKEWQWVKVYCSWICLQHDMTIIMYNIILPQYSNQSCNVLYSRGSGGWMKNIIITKRRKWIDRDSVCTWEPFEGISLHHLHSFYVPTCSLHLYGSSKLYPQIALGEMFFYELLRLMQLAADCIRNEKITRQDEVIYFVSLHVTVRRYLTERFGTLCTML
jgi:hypothetical protein